MKRLKLGQTYNLDCLDGFKYIKDNSVNLIITSPPYNNWRNKRTQKSRKEYWNRTNIEYDNYLDKMSDKEYAKWQIKVINECIRVLKPNGTLCYNHKDRIFNFEVTSPLTWILKSNAIYRQRITWDRCGMQAYNPVRFYRVDEDIYILGKEAKDFKWNKDCAKYLSIWKIPPSKNKGHPCSFPDELVNRLVLSFSDKNDIVLDPFAGIGTVQRCCDKLGRRYIGFEISKKYISLGEKFKPNGLLIK